MNEFDDHIRLKNSGLNVDSNPDLCDAGAVLHQLSCQANWESVVVWIDYSPLSHGGHIVPGDQKSFVLPRSGNHGGEAWRGKTSFFGLPRQYGRRVTRANNPVDVEIDDDNTGIYFPCI